MPTVSLLHLYTLLTIKAETDPSLSIFPLNVPNENYWDMQISLTVAFFWSSVLLVVTFYLSIFLYFFT